MRTILLTFAVLMGLPSICQAQRDTTFTFTVKVPVDVIHDSIAYPVYVYLPDTTKVVTKGHPWGFFNVTPFTVSTPLVMYYPSVSSLASDLKYADSVGKKVMLTMTGGGHSKFRTCLCVDSTFNWKMWYSEFDKFKAIDLSKYINDGTIVALSLLDESQNAPVWFGKKIPLDTVDNWARYARSRYPGLALTTRDDAMDMGIKKDWKYYDAAWEQYSIRNGTIESQLGSNITAAQNANINLIFGVNGANGGTVVSGCFAGTGPGQCAYSTADFTKVLTTIINTPRVCATPIWVPNQAYYDKYTPTIKPAIDSISKLAKNRVIVSCKRSR
jgi:hypothetical protein